MEIFDDVTAQMEAIRLPLYAISVSAAHAADSPLYLFLHWHGFQRATPLHLPGISIPPRPVPSSLLQVDGPWYSDLLRDEVVLQLAWRLGAWDVRRTYARACNEIGAPPREALQCRQAFGEGDEDHPVTLDETPQGRRDAMQLAARRGYWRWLFHPVKGGLWSQLAQDDETLASDGARAGPCPVAPLPTEGRGRQTVYRMGRITRLILPRRL
ncbi:diguanylate cyclase [Herbaspirillum seropedicae]|uniref:diguanylate cyclase n=1 Tax=Herbaspirillum seropedicae TaxID=964 RepID=UPI003FCE588B